MASGAEIFSATYSNVPVYELKVNGEHIMRRRSDDWINATHILKIAGFDKPARTRILERDVQKGVHEKIQGGYGKYQGTWIPLHDGRNLAQKNGILAKIIKIFDYVPGDHSPPPAPKHTTAASNRSKPTKASAAAARRTAVPQNNGKTSRQPVPEPARRLIPPTAYYAPPDVPYEEENIQYMEQDDPGRATPDTTSMFAEEDSFLPLSQASNASRKRKRDEDAMISASDLEHTIYGDELLDYFVTSGDDPTTSNIFPPVPPTNFDVNRPIDTHGNNALHWACAMGDVHVVKDLLQRGANPAAENVNSGETPLMRAVLFTNNYDKQCFGKIVDLLAGTIIERDRHGATVFHHVAETSRSKHKWSCCRYYCEVLINKMLEMGSSFVRTVLSSTDANGDTAVLCAVRNGCIKVALILLNHCPEAGDVQNLQHESANELLLDLRQQRESLEQPPSSPPRASDPSMSIGGRKRSRHDRRGPRERQPLSRAASNVLSKITPLIDSSSQRLASMYDSEMKEKDMAIAEAKAALSEFESQRSKIRQETYALMARAEAEGFANENIDPSISGMLGSGSSTGEIKSDILPKLRHEFETLLRKQESILEQKDHAVLHSRILAADKATPPQSFRASNNNSPLTPDQARAALPLALALHREQLRRRELVREIARLHAEAGTSEKVGKCRKLVAIATGLKEEDLDGMSKELLESLEAGRRDTGGDHHLSGPGIGAGGDGIESSPLTAIMDNMDVTSTAMVPRTPS